PNKIVIKLNQIKKVYLQLSIIPNQQYIVQLQLSPHIINELKMEQHIYTIPKNTLSNIFIKLKNNTNNSITIDEHRIIGRLLFKQMVIDNSKDIHIKDSQSQLVEVLDTNNSNDNNLKFQ